MTKSAPFIIAAFLLLSSAAQAAGVSIGGTRFVYSEKTHGVRIGVRNSSDTPWLISTTVKNGGSWPGTMATEGATPFTAIPPLFSLKGGSENNVHLVKTGGALPQDRESLFTLMVTAIPSGSSGPDSVQIADRSLLKLFYRPVGLAGDPQQAYQQLRWSRHQGHTVVSNPTAYYVTLFNLTVNSRVIEDAGVVAPFSQRETDWCDGRAACQLSWQTINDYGRVMPVVKYSTVPVL